MLKTLKALPVVIVILLVIILVSKIISDNKNKLSSEVSLFESRIIGKELPDLTIPTSKVFRSSELLDKKLTIVNVFASWCVACEYEHKFFKEISKINEVKVIGIAWRDKEEDTQSWLSKNTDPYDLVAYDSLGKYGISLGIRGVPETFVVSQDGKIIKHIRGNIDENFIKYLQEYLDES